VGASSEGRAEAAPACEAGHNPWELGEGHSGIRLRDDRQHVRNDFTVCHNGTLSPAAPKGECTVKSINHVLNAEGKERPASC
jgi:hypothetical protein